MTAGCPARSIPEPAWLRDLPRLAPAPHRKQAQLRLPTPAWSLPGHASLDWTRARALALRGRCFTCGCTLPPGTRYLVLYGEGLAQTCNEDRPVLAAIGPSHLSCCLASCLLCPALQHPRSPRTWTSTTDRDTRGAAAIVGFKRFGIVTEPTSSHLFGYVDEVYRLPFVAARDLKLRLCAGAL
jgi:hypothetical protein